MELTLFQLHLPNAEFNAPFAGRTSPDGDEDEAEAPVAESEPSARLGPLTALLAFAGLALLARYLRGGETEQSTLDEVEA